PQTIWRAPKTLPHDPPDGALLPAVQTLLVYNSTSQISGRIFSYNQSFRDIGNVTGPLIGASVSANYGFRAVFLVTAGVV
ncbi:hypothetical protein LAN32_26270, partial [Mycobacterium tuberculosis]|nr:hypothetical protein [Mycobacterium tuberculosis]